jgi:hypothetical protein
VNYSGPAEDDAEPDDDGGDDGGGGVEVNEGEQYDACNKTTFTVTVHMFGEKKKIPNYILENTAQTPGGNI